MDVNDAGGPANGLSRRPSISADGRHVAFHSLADNLVPGDSNFSLDVFAHDRDTDADGVFDEPGAIRTVRVNVTSSGAQATLGDSRAFIASLSADGRFVGFTSLAANLVAGDANLGTDDFVHDRDTDEDGIFDEPGAIATTASERGDRDRLPGALRQDALRRRVGLARRPLRGLPGRRRGARAVAPPARRVPDLLPAGHAHRADPAPERSGPRGAARFSLDTGSQRPAFLSLDARRAFFKALATNLVPGDGNGEADAFVRGTPFQSVAFDLTGDGLLDDVVLTVLDTEAPLPAPVTLAPAGDVSVAGGNAAFLRPEAGLIRAGIDLNDDGDTDDLVVQRYANRGAVDNLGLAATHVAISAERIAALYDEAAGGVDRNADGDDGDRVVATLPVGAPLPAAWSYAGRAADSLRLAGSRAAFLSPEAAQGPGAPTRPRTRTSRTARSSATTRPPGSSSRSGTRSAGSARVASRRAAPASRTATSPPRTSSSATRCSPSARTSSTSATTGSPPASSRVLSRSAT